MQDLKSLNLTSEDFKLLVDGLDALPERGTAGQLIGDLFMASLVKDNKEAKEKMEQERRETKSRKRGNAGKGKNTSR